ncbi:uncharacterized protein RJT20DRAFT_55187 [Scheffersomyces xylosifermentans]|uniref:uncharacterized protein n=1 Tax=Scheffersomyces xylosifermentans TaxID=1304137 RepID=UPI00315DA117
MFATYNVHPSISLAYGFPSANDKSLPSMLPRDILLSKNLKIEDDPQPKAPVYVKTPISKTFSNSPFEEPLNELLEESRKLINQYKLEFPTLKEEEAKKSRRGTIEKTTPRNLKITTKKNVRGTKRTRMQENSSFDADEEEENIDANRSSIYNTPIPNKTIFFSPSGSSKKKPQNLLQSTPVSVLKEAQLNSQRSAKKLLKTDRATVVQKTIEPKKEVANTTADDSEYDLLACHADNIMRMAVDSTMLGSTFNGSFSSFNNTFANDSVLGIKSKKKFPDFFVDDEADKSVIEDLKSHWSGLDRSKATKIEINDDDLRAAVHE